jgi:hypothetical protein
MADKVLFIPSHLSAVFNEGGTGTDELIGQYGTDLHRFRKSLSSNAENGTHFHSK